MTVIAMTREMGSGGRQVAERVAEKLGLTLILHELVKHDLAERMNVRESDIHNRFESGASLRERWKIPSRKLATYVAEEVFGLAQKGNVLIRGWGACVILRDVTHVARIRICAPIALREEAAMRTLGIADRSAARAEIDRNDATHERILGLAYGVERDDAMLYDMTLNTGRVSIDTCVQFVCELVGRPEFRETQASRTLLDDAVLERQLRLKLRERFTTGTGVSSLEAKVSGGRVLLTGVAIHEALAAEAADIVLGTMGVKALDNQVEIVRRPWAL